MDFKRIRPTMKTPIVVDLRNVYRPEEMHMLGFQYSSVARLIQSSVL
ncbi:UDP-glucose 6-dehydrogenase (UDP-Glc dehydrogenase) (UDP-GlcDH) (UDPGDH) (fragment) [Bradyrhizobium sp. ORS 375]